MQSKEIIRIDIFSPLKTTLFSHYGYVYLISDKSLALEKFKIFKREIEIKIVRLHLSNEQYGRYDETGKYITSFAKNNDVWKLVKG